MQSSGERISGNGSSKNKGPEGKVAQSIPGRQAVAQWVGESLMECGRGIGSLYIMVKNFAFLIKSAIGSC